MAGDFQNSNNKTKTHSDQKNLSCHQVQSSSRHLSFLCDQTDTFYQQQDTKLRIAASVRCYNASQTFHPVARCYYRLCWIRHSKHPKPARPSDLRLNTRKYSPEICDRACGDRRVSSGVKSAQSWVFPVDRDVSGRERLACVPVSLTHARSRSQGWECRNVTSSPVYRTRARGNRGLWEFEFKDNGYF